MTSKRNLGPVLALTGAGIAVAAVIAGFILVGGPGDARERRLDQMTMDRITAIFATIQCAYNATGAIPSTIDEARTTRALPPGPDVNAGLCGDSVVMETLKVAPQAAAPGEITYSRIDSNHVKICGNFRRPKLKEESIDYYRTPLWAGYPQLSETRPAGVHCYDLELLKGVDFSLLRQSHAGHMDVFE